ncbi:retrovirus-related pol polyprotein from transposon TNT 1-94 [Tanacetum coccineum]
MKPLRFQDESNMAAYAFAAAEEEDTHEPLTYQEAIGCEDSSKWKCYGRRDGFSKENKEPGSSKNPQLGKKLSRLPKTFWAEATCTAAYLINRSPSTVIEKKTPTKMWSGHPSDYRMLRIFGCVAFLHDKQGKLKPRAVKCFLLGYPEGVKVYRLYRVANESPKIVTSRNVVFNESVMYKDMLKDSGAGDKSVEELHFKWKAAMEEEMDSLRKNKTWELVDPLTGQKLVSSKWLFKIKEGIEAVQKPRYKARLVARGFTQREAIWLRGLLEELGVKLNTVAVNCDNQGAIHLSRNHVFHERTKHINVRYHFIREVLEAKTVKVLKVGTEHNVADALTNVVPGLKLHHCLELLHVGVG